MKRKLNKLLITFKKITSKKHHLDFIVAILTIPVLLSVIILNYTNLNNIQKSNENLKLVPTPQEKIIIVPQNSSKNNLPTNPTCAKDIGQIEISSPKEEEVLSDNPVCITINYDSSNYCSVVWSYKINNGSWSDFSSNNPCIYNLPAGNVKFNLKVQSTVIQKEINISRNFIYNGNSIIPTQIATSSAN